ncbi:DUF1802 family protein [Paludisphaera rhizosphaerae]|uniref:DUF1802 family protein n=1 Tax=Paludisphaera rhizosphaerae TaxID=2711216 RepID=UPI0013EB198A|nr:DUF1802 family protein [Paludisphaera rhizosphaerae]
MNDVPPTCDVGFKEWSGVCAALASGRQTVILRKGGIAEEGGRFTPDHRVFWLYPTRIHEAQQGLREEPAPVENLTDASLVLIRSLAVVDSVHLIEREDELDRLEPFHVWTDETVHKRFHYRRPGLWVLSVRVWDRAEAEVIRPSVEQLGCKTWIHLDSPISTSGLVSALSDEKWQSAQERLRAAIGSHRRDGELE